MGCTSSKGNTNSPTTAESDSDQQLINDQFRQWLKSNRPKVDEYVLNDVFSTAQQSDDINDYRTIVTKALDLLSERHDIKTTNKLGKIVQKEVSLASAKQVAHTIHVLKQTAEKLRNGQILLDNCQQDSTTTNDETKTDANAFQQKSGQLSSGEPGINLKEALEKARILFYKGKQAAIFANPSGGYLVKVIDDNDDALNQDGNLLRSIIVTEVKMRPKPIATHSTLFSAVAPPPPPSSKLLDEKEIVDDFRRSIDAALKGLEVIYQTSPTKSSGKTQNVLVDKASSSSSSSNLTRPTSEVNAANLAEINREEKVIKSINDEEQAINQIDIQPELVVAIDDMNEIMLDITETTTESEIGNPISSIYVDTTDQLANVERIVKEVKEYGDDTNELKETLPEQQSSSGPLDHTQTLQNEESLRSSVLEQQTKLNDENNSKSSIVNEEKSGEYQNQSNESAHLPTSQLNISTSSSDEIEKEPVVNNESSLPPVILSHDTNTTVKSPSHNVTYTEIIHSETRDGEQTRRFITESYDGHTSANDDETTTLKVVTKSEFSNHPSLGEKTMEQSVQVITVKVRNETKTTKNSSPTSENNDISNHKESLQNDANLTTDIHN
ncbi:unnamed protein product [Rotaria magnacalcarata]|uniref:Uncharacterized protein n=1 Tax=Rotaria magnacalcarata TaxID=392030 RepID=A0A816KWY5_9BILA|nr:unnamed protein product [Rotaria magnacalcarata]CAF3910237.1 unnamed protein product [Rotaria magnacalcarata]